MPNLPGSINIKVPTSSAATNGGSSMVAATAVPTIISQQQLQQIQKSQQVLQLQQNLAQEEAARQQQQLQLQQQQLLGLRGLDAAALQQLIRGGALLGHANTNMNANQQPPTNSSADLLGALLSNHPQPLPQASPPQLQPLNALLLQQEAQRQQAQQFQALQSQMGGPLVSPQIQQLQLQLQIAQVQQAQAQAQAHTQAHTQLQVHNLLSGGTSDAPARPNPSLPANIDVASLAAILNANSTSS